MKINVYQYTIETYEENGRFYGKLVNNNARAYNAIKEHFRFRTKDEAEKWAESHKESIERYEQMKAERKAERKAFKNPAKVGDILVSSWGYDQTNIDYYQVTKIMGKMVEIKTIGCETIPDSTYSHGMADTVRPVKDRFLGGWQAKTLKKLVKASGDNGYYVSIASYAIASKTTENDNSYRSWYH